MLADQGLSPIAEVSLATGRRVDVIAIGKTGEITVVEVKSGLADYQTDQKWQSYLDYCDHFYFAVDTEFPKEVLPTETGLIVADAYGAVIHRTGEPTSLSSARRKAMLIRFGQAASSRLLTLTDPGFRGL